MNDYDKAGNVKTSPFLDEVRAKEFRTIVLRQGRKRFGKAPTKNHEKALEGITDLGQLEAVLDTRPTTKHTKERKRGQA